MQETPAQDAGDSSGSSRRRKKRRRGRAAASNHPDSGISGRNQPHPPGETHPNSETVTSPKGKKAANRRGRRRWQASRNTKNGHYESAEKSNEETGTKLAGTEPDSVARSGKEKHRPRETDIRLPVRAAEDGNPQKRGYHGRRPRHGQHNAPLYAALDLGTNNCRLLIARPEERGFRVVDAYSRIVRLGEGVGSNKLLSSAAMDRAIDALANCHRKLADRGVMRSRLIATEACRAAENGADFIERVKAETGLALEVVNRETEARLAVAGCASLVDHEADGVILFDIGGGSSEIVWLDLRNRSGARGYALTRFIRSWISLPVGVVNLAERHGGVHVTPDIFEAMVEDAAEHLASFSLADNLAEAISSGRVHMLGTSGTVTTLAGVHLGLRRYDRRRVDGTWLDDIDVSKMIDQLRDMPYEARVENPCIGADRADLVLAGCAILEAIRRRWTCSRLRVADRGLREGILTELMAADGVWAHRKPGRRPERRRQRNRT
nr:Ppx/GppA phosphatase family protein [Labrenzia sp. DG1229]